jgi:hypothetical protein
MFAIQKYKAEDTQNCHFACILYGRETWSLILREESRLRVFENRVLRKIFGPMRVEVTREWKKLHNEELNDLYCSPSIIRVTKSWRMRKAGHVARMGKRKRSATSPCTRLSQSVRRLNNCAKSLHRHDRKDHRNTLAANPTVHPENCSS